mgnify:CR=1 FL=1
MKCKIYAEDVHYLTVDECDVESMLKWLKDTGHTNVVVHDSSVMPVITDGATAFLYQYRGDWYKTSPDSPPRWHEEDDNGVSNADRYLDELDYQ